LYVRFTPLKRRNGDGFNEYALNEFKIYSGGSRIGISGGTVTSDGYNGEPLHVLVDGNDNNKIFPFTNPVVIGFGSDTRFDGYQLTYMNALSEHPAFGRTPIRWTIEVSSNSYDWRLIDDRSGEDQQMVEPALEWGEYPAETQIFTVSV
jgi:hypothetical protein